MKPNLHPDVRQHFAKARFVYMWLGMPVFHSIQVVQTVVHGSLHIEVARIPPDNLELTEVRGRQPASNHSSKMGTRFEQNHMKSLACGGISGDDPRGRSSIY